MNEKLIATYLDKWQAILRLRDYDIHIVIAEASWRKSGDIKIDEANKMAALIINEKVEPEFLEEVVIHELLHLKLWGMDQMIEGLLSGIYGQDEQDPKRVFAYDQFMGVLETTTQDLTKALLSATGEERKPLSNRVNREVAIELGKQ